MAKMIQLRHVPDDLHRKLKVRAAQAGMSLSDYLLTEARRLADIPTIEELRERIGRRRAVPRGADSALLVRGQRGPLPVRARR